MRITQIPYNALREMVHRTSIPANTLSWNLDTRSLENGVFLYELSSNGGRLATGSLVVTR